MLDVAIDWVGSQWFSLASPILTLASLAVAILALWYAKLAYRSSKDAAAATRVSELANLRNQAKASLADAERSLISLRGSVQMKQKEWDHYERKHMPIFGQRRIPAELQRNAQIQQQGYALLQDVNRYFAQIDGMNVSQLEKGFQEAKSANLKIERFIGDLEIPTTFIN
jgi:hypothetical protein